MTDIERIELLRQLRAQTSSAPRAEIDQEVSEIDATIADYEEQIAELEAKIASLDNYLYKNPNEETRDLTEELLEESFAEQLATLDREDKEYEELKDLGQRIYDSYSDDIAQLDTDIAAIERRLRKNEIAVSKNLRMQLSVEELEELTSELEVKKSRKVEFEGYQQLYATDVQDYSELLEANNKKRQILLAKQDRLKAVKESRKNNSSIINRHQLRLDQDELARLQAGVLALQTRKEHITFDTYAVLDRLIADAERKKDEPAVESEAVVEEEPETFTTMPVLELPKKDEEVDYEAALTTPSELDEEREAVVEDSSEELIEKKKTGKIKEFLQKHYKKFIAAALALLAVLGLKQCTSTLDYIEFSNDDVSIHGQPFDSDDEEDITLGDQEDIQQDTDQNIVPDPDGEDKSDELIPKPDVPSGPSDSLDSDPIVDDTLGGEDTVEKNVELSPGESVANISDIVQGEAISHGDEVGTALGSGIALKDYTEQGSAVVDLTPDTPTEGVVMEDAPVVTEGTQSGTQTEDKTLHQTLEEFFGGPISITDSENAYEMGEDSVDKQR